MLDHTRGRSEVTAAVRYLPGDDSAATRRSPEVPSPHRWTLLTYKLPPSSSRHKVATWRQLRRTGSLSLGSGAWAIGHGEDGRPNLRVATRLIAEAGGRYEAVEVGASDGEMAKHRHQLQSACAELWFPFFNELDRVIRDVEPESDLDGLAPALDQLRSLYLEARRQDLLDSEAARRARRRLVECYVFLDDALPDGEAGRTWLRDACPEPAVVTPVDCWARRDGTNTYLARVRPVPPVGWERSFARFESVVYLPSPDRPPLEHGAFTFVGPAETCPAVVESLDKRLRRFHLSLV